MAESNPTQFAADLSATCADLITVYYNALALKDTYNDTGLATEVAALAQDTDAVPDMGGLTKADVTNAINTLDALVTLMEDGHRTNANKVVATVPPAS